MGSILKSAKELADELERAAKAGVSIPEGTSGTVVYQIGMGGGGGAGGGGIKDQSELLDEIRRLRTAVLGDRHGIGYRI